MIVAPHKSPLRLFPAVAVVLALAGPARPVAVRAADPDPAQVEFFEKKIRPLLADHCYECHGAKPDRIKGSLRLDTRAGLRKGGATGPAVVANKPDESLLFLAVQGKAHDLERMPSAKAGKEPLSTAQIADLETWIRNGAVDPRADAPPAPGDPSLHWAFHKPVAPPLPAVRDTAWPRRDLDRFVLARLEEKGLVPSPEADRRTLLRRATHDLTGLPPTPAAMDAFLADPAPDAYERTVDRLLASPRYGERWGRHWLDVARYADSKGYVFEEERRYAYAYTYRDWVVDALNRDLPYDRFLVAQIAGDQLATKDDPWPMAAQGFLTLGRRFLNNETDIIDDRLDVVFRGTQGLTIGCARCHDHKYDPIPTADYYSLYGVFASSHEPGEKPLLGPNPDPTRAADYAVERARREKELADFRASSTANVAATLRQRVGEYLAAAWESMALDGSRSEALARTRKLDPGLVAAWKSRLEKWRGDGNPVFVPWFELAALGTNGFPAAALAKVQALAAHPDAARPPNAVVLARLSEHPPTDFAGVAALYGEAFRQAEKAWQEALGDAAKTGKPGPTALADAQLESLRQILDGDDSPLRDAMAGVDRFFDVPTAQKIRALRRKTEELDATHPGAPLRAMALLDKPQAVEPVVFKRGNPGNPGPRVPRRFLGLIDGDSRKPFATGSGRLELARAIANPDNPLTARVFVNRVWLRHFGAPLVGTPSDFGLRSDPPVNPALLDHLAVDFVRGGWSIKRLHRELLLSATYRQASDPVGSAVTRAAFARNATLDPGNVHLWRMNRKRADFEALRDSLLYVSGQLDQTFGGQPVEMFETQSAPRRTLYGYIDRQNLPGLLRSFDFASPDVSSALRFQTTVPQQALYLMNNPFVAEQARRFAGRAGAKDSASPDARIRRLYALAFQREPGAGELENGRRFVAAQSKVRPEPRPAAAWSYGYGAFDPTARRTAGFRPFATYKDKEARWQPTAVFPNDDERGHAYLDAKGGHPGRTPTEAVIRRWTAPVDATLVVDGELEHPSSEGDGVRARVVSDRQGVLGEWTAKSAKTPTHVAAFAVARGETIDFAIDCVGSDNSDSFQ
ncbi:MAG: DUF1549 domain-containing protein, partial [Verrucomicrobia bacterium]